MSSSDILTKEYLCSILNYDKDTGIFTNKIKRGGKAKAGIESGRVGARDGYRRITVCGKEHMAHRLVFLYMTGEMPTRQVDHINGDRTDNRFCNLRLATQSQNSANMRTKTSKSGLKGAYWFKDRNIWKSSGMLNGSTKFLGHFDCPAAAHFAYVVWAEKTFGEFARAK